MSFPYEKFSRETKITYLDSDLEEIGSDLGLKKIEVIVRWSSIFSLKEGVMSIVNLVAER